MPHGAITLPKPCCAWPSERERLAVINDQWGAPTSAELLADITAHAIAHLQRHPQDGGLYHCTAERWKPIGMAMPAM